MRPDNSFLVTSARGHVLRLRQHALAFLSHAQEDAVCFEPSLLSPGAALDAQLSVTSDETRFAWSLSPGSRGGASSSTSVILLGHRGGQAVTGRVADATAHSAWNEWAGCDSIDLSTADESGSLQGDSFSLAVPAQHSLISFSHPSGGQQITVKAETPNPELLRVSLWHRVQNDEWIQRSSDSDLPADGLRIPMPAFQGAIVVEGRSGGLEGLQFFGFRRLHDGDKADRAYLEKRYAKRQQKPVEAWPLWFRNYFLDPFHVFSRDDEVSASELVRKLRIEIRGTILASVFPAGISDWRPDLTIEELTRIHRPELAKLIASGQDPATLRLASEVQDSPHLARATRWAGDPGKHLAACLRLLPIESAARNAQLLLNPLCASWGPSEQLRSALLDVPSMGSSLESSVQALYDDLARAIANEFQVSPDQLTREHVQETLLDRSLQELFAELKISAPGASLLQRLRLLASEVEASLVPGLTELIDRGLEAGLLELSFIEHALSRHSHTLSLLQSSLQAPSSLIDEDSRNRVLQCLSNTASLRSLLCKSQLGSVRSIVTRRASELDAAASDRLLDLETRSASLYEWLEYGIAQALEWTRRRDLLEEERLRREQLRLLLPDGMDPDSEAAEQWLSERSQELAGQLNDFAAAFPASLTEQEHLVLENAVAILEHVLSAQAADRLGRMCDLQALMRQGETNLTAIADRLLVQELPTNGKGNRAIRHFFRERKYRVAKKVLDLSAVQMLLSRNPALPNRAWLDADEDFGKKMIHMHKALQQLDKLDSDDEVERLVALWEENRNKIDRRGDLAGVFQHWEDQLHRRIQFLRDDLAASGHLPPSRVSIFKFIHALESRSNYKPGSLIDGMEPDLLTAKLLEHHVIRPNTGR